MNTLHVIPVFFFLFSFLFFLIFCRDHRRQRGHDDPLPEELHCFACEVKSGDREEIFDLITVLHGAQCAAGGDGNYNAHAGLLSCPRGDVFPGASRGDGGMGTMKERRPPPVSPSPDPLPPPKTTHIILIILH